MHDAGNYTISCAISGGNCNEGGIPSNNALLKGPGGSNVEVPVYNFPKVGEVGSYLCAAEKNMLQEFDLMVVLGS